MTKQIRLTFDQALADLTAIVAELGPDYIYEQPVGSTNCLYFHAGEPSCGIGRVLARHGVKPDDVDFRMNRATVTRISAYREGEPRKILVTDRPTMTLLSKFQEHQDQGRQYSEALRNAVATVKARYPSAVPTVNHTDYPHHPGYLHDCPACEASCHCTEGNAECVFEGEHNGSAS